MDNPLYLNGKGVINTRLSAIENVLNEITRQMYEGRVPQAQADIANNTTNTETNSGAVDDLAEMVSCQETALDDIATAVTELMGV